MPITDLTELPGAIIADWRFDQGSGYGVHNDAYSPRRTLDNQLWGPSQRFGLAGGPYSKTSGVTITDNAVASRYGQQTAARVQMTGGASRYIQIPSLGLTPGGGQWTIVLDAKRHGGTDQTFRFGLQGSSGAINWSADKTAGEVWAAHSHTATVTGSLLHAYIAIDSATNATDFDVDGCVIRAGADTTPWEEPRGDLILASGGNRPTWSATGLVFSSTSAADLAFATWADQQSLSQGTVYALITQTSDDANGTILTGPDGTRPLHLAGGNGATGLWPDAEWAGRDFGTLAVREATFRYGTRVVALTWDGATLVMYLDGARVARYRGAAATATFRQLAVGRINTALGWTGTLHYLHLNDTAHTKSEVWDATEHLRGIAVARGLTPAVARRVITFEGDSMTMVATDATNQGWAKRVMDDYLPDGDIQGTNYAQGGSGYDIESVLGESIQDRQDFVVTTRAPDTELAVAIVYLGTNDLLSRTAEQTFENLKSLCAYYLANGIDKILVLTPLPAWSTTDANSTYNVRRKDFIASVRAEPLGTYWHAVADLAADEIIGADLANANTTYFTDGVHLATAGVLRVVPIVEAALESLLYPAAEITVSIGGEDRADGYTHALGTVADGSTQDVVITISNAIWEDGDTLTLSYGVTGDITIESAGPATIEAGESGTLTIRVSTASLGAKSGTLTITSNDDDVPEFVINFTATVADLTPPALSVPTIPAAGTTIVLTASEAITLASGRAYTDLTLAGTSRTVTGGEIDGTTITLTLSGGVLSSETVTITVPAGTFEDGADNPSSALTSAAVLNDSTEAVPYILSRQSSATGLTVTTTFSEAVTGNVGFSFDVNGSPRAASYLSGLGTNKLVHQFAPANRLQIGDTVTQSYAEGDVEDSAGFSLAGFTDAPVVNNTTEGLGTPAANRIWRVVTSHAAHADNVPTKHPETLATFGLASGPLFADGETIISADIADADGLTITDEQPSDAAFPDGIGGTVAVGEGVLMRIAGGTPGRRHAIELTLTGSLGTVVGLTCVLEVSDP